MVKEDFRRAVASRLKAARRERTLTQRQLADLGHSTQQNISRYEKGFIPESWYLLAQLHAEQAIDLNWLLAARPAPATDEVGEKVPVGSPEAKALTMAPATADSGLAGGITGIEALAVVGLAEAPRGSERLPDGKLAGSVPGPSEASFERVVAPAAEPDPAARGSSTRVDSEI